MSIYQLLRCLAFIMALSLASLAATASHSTVLSDQVKDRKGLGGRDLDRFQQKKKGTRVVPAAAAPTSLSATLTRLTVRVTPKNSLLPLPTGGLLLEEEEDPLPSIDISCRIKCIVERVQDLPTISFYLLIANETVLPLSAGLPGVGLYTSSSDSRQQKPFKDADNRRAVTTYRSDTHLTLNYNAYPILRRGRNQFFCRAHSSSIGLLKSDGFVVYRQ